MRLSCAPGCVPSDGRRPTSVQYATRWRPCGSSSALAPTCGYNPVEEVQEILMGQIPGDFPRQKGMARNPALAHMDQKAAALLEAKGVVQRIRAGEIPTEYNLPPETIQRIQTETPADQAIDKFNADFDTQIESRYGQMAAVQGQEAFTLRRLRGRPE